MSDGRATIDCTEKCWKPVKCTICGLTKKPVGRDSIDNGLCNWDCEGYTTEPQPGHLWPSEALWGRGTP